jgi:ribonuclease G
MKPITCCRGWGIVASTLYYDHHENIARALVVKDGVVTACFFDRLDRPQRMGAISTAVVTRLMPGGKGAFATLKGGENGYLSHADDLTAGAKITVQIKNEAREEKAVSVTQRLSLPGIYLVHQMDGNGVQLSRRMGKGNVPSALAEIMRGRPGGWTIRSAALQAGADVIRKEADDLAALAQKVHDGMALPAPGAFEQAVLAGAGESGFNGIAEEGVALEKGTAYLRAAFPDLLEKLTITRRKNALEDHDLEAFYETLQQDEISLPRGGGILFEAGRTLTAVDVNAGDRGHFLEVNLEAAALIMQHLRWRHIGGMVVIDFLKMKNEKDVRTVTERLYALTQEDVLPCDVYGFTRMGLCEISRARRGHSLRELQENRP